MTLVYRVLGAHLLLFVALGSAIAEPSSKISGSLFFQSRGVLAPTGSAQPLFLTSTQSPSLMPTDANLGFFAPLPARQPAYCITHAKPRYDGSHARALSSSKRCDLG
jgi:hypothetical protein